jgi:hypothetical protein
MSGGERRPVRVLYMTGTIDEAVEEQPQCI